MKVVSRLKSVARIRSSSLSFLKQRLVALFFVGLILSREIKYYKKPRIPGLL